MRLTRRRLSRCTGAIYMNVDGTKSTLSVIAKTGITISINGFCAMRLITLSLMLASTAFRSAIAQTPDRSATLASVLEGRRVIEQVVTSVGGRDALRSVKTIEMEETIKEVN